MHLALVVVGGLRSEAGVTAAGLGRAALAAGHRLSVFCAGDGTAHATALAPLREAGARLTVCSADAAARGLDRPGTPGRGSFVDLGGIALEADCCLVL